MIRRRQLFFLMSFAFILMSGCGDGHLFTSAGRGAVTDNSISTPWGNVEITTDAFLLASSYPADLIIPDIEGMRDTAFIVSTLNPSGVLAVDLTSTPYEISKLFAGVIAPAGTGIPAALHISSSTQAFLLTSTHIIHFNPASGKVIQSISALKAITLSTPLKISSPFDIDKDGVLEDTITTITPSYPGGIWANENSLYVTSANYLHPIQPAVAAPGTIQVFSLKGSTISRTGHIVTTAFNPVAIQAVDSEHIIVVSSGVSEIKNGITLPQSHSGVDVINTAQNKIISHMNFGKVALSFQKPSITPAKQLFLGSITYGELYQADLSSNSIIHDHQNPIVITGSQLGDDFLTSTALTVDAHYLFVSSFNNSAIFPVDITTSPPALFPTAFSEAFDVGFPSGISSENPTGSSTGVGALTSRPGIPDIDYSGADLFALTGNPGTLVAINTRGSVDNPATPISDFRIVPDTVALDDSLPHSQLTLSIQLADGTSIDSITSEFTNPFSGYPLQVNWQVDDPSIAAVSPSGLASALSNGTTLIRAHLGSFTATSTITVALQEAESSENPIMAASESDADPFIDTIVSYTIGSLGGYGENYLPQSILGPPRGFGKSAGNDNAWDVFSLGCNGELIVEMTDLWMADGEGVDFIVFENPFYVSGAIVFSERAQVSVSQDGTTFFDFPCNDTTPPFLGCAGVTPVYSHPSNGIDPTDPAVAGGDGFDLADVGLDTARFIRIRSVNCQGSQPKAGFDLDAISIRWGIKPQW